MKTRSAKNKGKLLQNLVRDKILETYPGLHKDDVKSTTMGEGGEDVQLSPAARALFPYSVECKSHKAFAVYKILEQAESHGKYEPLVVLKANRKEPVVVIKLKEFFSLLEDQEEAYRDIHYYSELYIKLLKKEE